MEKWIKDWWADTKKDTIEGLWFLSAFVPIIYFIFNSPDRIKFMLMLIESKDFIVIGFLCFGVCVVSFWLEQVFRFLLKTIWFLLTPIRLYISRKMQYGNK